MAQPTIEPITDATLPAFASFLQQHMQGNRSAADWERGLRNQWTSDLSNFGFMLKNDQDEIVGGIGAYYADRFIRGKPEKFCNITSWCVLDTYRQQSMKLAMTVIKQPGYHFTDFSPTKVVGGTLKFFKFQEMDDAQAVVLNLPGVSLNGGRLLDRATDIESALSGSALKTYQDHAVFPWLKHVLIGSPGEWCHVIYKRSTFKHIPAATILYLSDRHLFSRHFRRLSTFLLLRGMVSTHVECRMLDAIPWPSVIRSGFNRKVFLSGSLDSGDIDYLYSERVALDL